MCGFPDFKLIPTGIYTDNFGGIHVLCFQSEADGNEVVMETSTVGTSWLDAYKHKELKLYD